MAVLVGSARIDENGGAHGGVAGDQSGREVSTQSWYLHAKGWRVFRAKSAGAAERIARCMERACANPNIGYDQYQRNTLYKAAEAVGFDVARVAVPCETDCSALVRVCCAYAGIMGLPADFRTGNMPEYLMRTGAFTELVGDRYQRQSAYLGRGDILVTRTSGHTVVALSNGPRYEGAGGRTLSHGDAGEDVRAMQAALIGLGYDLGRWGADGEFGDCTELAVMAFQRDRGLVAHGVADEAVFEALRAASGEDPAAAKDGERSVRIDGGDCWVRAEPHVGGRKLGVAKAGSRLPYDGETSPDGWLAVRRGGGRGWVSGKYGRVE